MLGRLKANPPQTRFWKTSAKARISLPDFCMQSCHAPELAVSLPVSPCTGLAMRPCAFIHTLTRRPLRSCLFCREECSVGRTPRTIRPPCQATRCKSIPCQVLSLWRKGTTLECLKAYAATFPRVHSFMPCQISCQCAAYAVRIRRATGVGAFRK